MRACFRSIAALCFCDAIVIDTAMSQAAPTAVLQAALSRFAEAAPVQQALVGDDGLPVFVAAPKFTGAKQGYYYGKGAFGVG